jgi:small multidrug resistance family-3 protein
MSISMAASLLQAAGLFALTAVAEITGSYLAYSVIRHGRPIWWLVPAALSIALFVWLLTLHPGAAGRTYAAYGGMYIAIAFVWLWLIERQQPNFWETVGVIVSLIGMGIIILAPQNISSS